MSDAIARDLALEACHAAPMGARLAERPVSDGATDYAVRSGDARAFVSYYGPDDDGTDLYLYTFIVTGWAAWEVLTTDAGDAEHVREALLTWARAL